MAITLATSLVRTGGSLKLEDMLDLCRQMCGNALARGVSTRDIADTVRGLDRSVIPALEGNCSS
jgi:hypothetical protein